MTLQVGGRDLPVQAPGSCPKNLRGDTRAHRYTLGFRCAGRRGTGTLGHHAVCRVAGRGIAGTLRHRARVHRCRRRRTGAARDDGQTLLRQRQQDHLLATGHVTGRSGQSPHSHGGKLVVKNKQRWRKGSRITVAPSRQWQDRRCQPQSLDLLAATGAATFHPATTTARGHRLRRRRGEGHALDTDPDPDPVSRHIGPRHACHGTHRGMGSGGAPPAPGRVRPLPGGWGVARRPRRAALPRDVVNRIGCGQPRGPPGDRRRTVVRPRFAGGPISRYPRLIHGPPGLVSDRL